MKDYKEMDKLVFDFGDDIKYFAQNHGGTMPPAIKSQLQELMFSRFAKEIDAITEREELEIKYKKKFYDKLLRAKLKLAKRDRADAWFDKVFQKYFNRGILEHLIIYGIQFLYKKDLFVAKRLFTQLNDDELLAQFTVSACEHLGWTSQNEPVEQPIMDEEQTLDTEEETDKTSETDEVLTSSDIVTYEPQVVQVTEQTQQPVAKVERTVTHEVMTVTQGNATSATETVEDVATNTATDEPDSFKSEENVPHFFRPGGKSSKK